MVDKLPDDVKFSAKTIQAHVEEIQQKADEDRQNAVNNTNKAMEENSRLLGEKEQLQRENNELRKGALHISKETQEKIDKLEQERRDYYEKYQASEKGKETLRVMLKEYNDEIVRLKAASEGGDEGAMKLKAEIDSLREKIEDEEQKSSDLKAQLEEKDTQIKDLMRESKEGFMRKALRINESPEELSQRERDALVSNIQIAIGQFQSKVEGALTQLDSFYSIDKPILKVLVETCSQAINVGTRLKVALMTASGFDAEVTDDDDYDLDDSGLELTLGA